MRQSMTKLGLTETPQPTCLVSQPLGQFFASPANFDLHMTRWIVFGFIVHRLMYQL